MVTDGTNVMYWEYKPNYQEVNNDVQKMFMAKVYNLNSNMSNSKCISTLLNSSNWTKFVKDTYADYSIGSPTLEMWIESWNGKYKNEQEIELKVKFLNKRYENKPMIKILAKDIK